MKRAASSEEAARFLVSGAGQKLGGGADCPQGPYLAEPDDPVAPVFERFARSARQAS
jgi:hypothetical protein